MSDAFLLVMAVCFGVIPAVGYFEGKIQRLRWEFEAEKRRLKDEIATLERREEIREFARDI